MKARIPEQGERIDYEDGSFAICNSFTMYEMCTIYAALDFLTRALSDQIKLEFPMGKKLNKKEKFNFEETKSAIGYADSAMKKIKKAGLNTGEHS